jgi:tetratricopeptide (TPR) repeat protein
MAHRPEDRYASPRGLAEDIERWMADEPVTAWREPLLRWARRWARRHRTAVTGAAAVLIVAVGGLSVGTVLIGRQRTEALRQRDLARSNLEQTRRIVDEMYTQVADHLTDQVGMDAYQREILKKALSFYEGVALPQSATPEVRYETGRARFRVGEIGYKFNRMADAEAAYKDAVAILGPLAAEYPARPDFAQACAGALNSLALVYTSIGRLDQAEALFQQAAGIRRKLIDDHPQDVAYPYGLARIENSLGVLYKRMNRKAEAEKALQRAATLDRELIAGRSDDPAIRAHLAKVLVNLGSSLDHVSRSAEIEAAYEQALTILRKLVSARPQAVEYRDGLASLQMTYGAHYAATGRPGQAEAANEEAIVIRRRLVEDHPDRVEFALELGTSYYSMAYMENLRRNHRATHDWATRAIQLVEASLRREARRDDFKQLLGFAYNMRAQALANLGRYTESLADWDRTIELAGERDERTPSLRAIRALALACLGDVGPAIEEISAIPKTGAYARYIRYNEACLFAVAAKAAAKDTARSPLERESLAERHAARAMDALAEARRAGYFRDPAHFVLLKSDRDLDALRSRDDFQLLMMDLAMPADPFARAH